MQRVTWHRFAWVEWMNSKFLVSDDIKRIIYIYILFLKTQWKGKKKKKNLKYFQIADFPNDEFRCSVEKIF